MRIFTEIDLQPNIQRYLPLIDSEKSYHKAHGLKHPSSTYNISFGKLESALSDFFVSYEVLLKEGFENRSGNAMTEVLKDYRTLLYTLREYLDDCFHVVKSFVSPPAQEKQDRNQYNWLNKNAPNVVEDFFQNISDYKKYLDLSVNELKHNNGILGSNSFYSKLSPEYCVGYFIANVVDECYEPVEKIHPRFHGMYTGFSFRRDLTYNIYNVYAVAEEISKLLQEKLAIDIASLKPQTTEAPEKRRKIFRKLMDMPRIHFPDEYVKPVPSLSITQDNRLKLEYPSQLTIKANKLEHGVLTHSTDGHTGKYRLLYNIG